MISTARTVVIVVAAGTVFALLVMGAAVIYAVATFDLTGFGR